MRTCDNKRCSRLFEPCAPAPAAMAPNNSRGTTSVGSVLLSIVSLLYPLLSGVTPACAQAGSFGNRTSLSIPSTHDTITEESPVVTFSPTKLEGNSTIQLVTAPSLAGLGTELIQTIREIHREYNSLLGGISGVHNTLRLIDANEFYAVTKLPNWTNAMFFRKQVVIPVDQSESVDQTELERSLRHEYFHAVTHALSKGRCPGWLDEGLAQHMEGVSHANLWQPLTQWLDNNEMVPFQRLTGGFTKLPPDMVAPAYAQSLVAARMVKAQFGMPAIRSFLVELGDGIEVEKAFVNAFGVPFSAFKDRVHQNITSGRFKMGQYR